MPSPLSVDLRERVAAAVAEGASFHRGAGRSDPLHRRSPARVLPARVARRPDRAGRADRHRRPFALLCPSWHHPQTGALYAAEQERADVREARRAWFGSQPDLDPDTLVFLDETAAAANMARRDGRAPRGERCRLPVPQGHYKTTTVTAALRSTGLCALSLVDGATNGARFRSPVADGLVPVLRPGDTVSLDNLQAHKVAGVREAIEAVGARALYLPPDSPAFNPIKQIFAKLKRLLRTATARTVPDLWAALRDAFTRFTPDAEHRLLYPVVIAMPDKRPSRERWLQPPVGRVRRRGVPAARCGRRPGRR